MYEIYNRFTAPYTSICYIACDWADGSSTRASGVVVGLNDVLTAHHVVYDASRGGYATKITVTPAADTWPYLTQPYGSYSDVGVIYARTSNWDPDGDGLLLATETQFDLAVLGMRSNIGSLTGVLPVANTSADFYGTMNGYPASGTGLMEQRVFADAADSASVFDVWDTLGPGASGGPLLQDYGGGSQVVGVLSAGTNDKTTFAGLHGGGNWEWLQNALRADDVVLPGALPLGNVLVSPDAAGAITYLGTRQADLMRGTSANEYFRGDFGLDTVAYSGPRGAYDMGHAAGNITVTDWRGRDGSDTLRGVERVAFSDMWVNLEIGVASQRIPQAKLQQLEELYVAFFNRLPEAEGLAFWIGQVQAGRTVASIADSFYSAALAYPTLTGYTAGMDNAAFIAVIYRNALGRSSVDADGLAYWNGALASGAETRGSLVLSILAGAHGYEGDPHWGWVPDLLDNKVGVAQRFAVELGLSDSTAEASIARGMQLAAAVTPTSTAAAIELIGVPDDFSTLG